MVAMDYDEMHHALLMASPTHTLERARKHCLTQAMQADLTRNDFEAAAILRNLCIAAITGYDITREEALKTYMVGGAE